MNELSGNSVLVTGATGFLGGHVARLFAENGWCVLAAMRSSSDASRLAGYGGIETVAMDLTDEAAVESVFSERTPRHVVHCAAYGVDNDQQDAEMAGRVNVEGTAHLVDAAGRNGARSFIHVGTGYEYGPATGPVAEDHPPRPRGAYATTKAEGSALALKRARASGLDLAVFRPFGLYGPDEGSHKFVPMLIGACLEDRRVELTAGKQARDYAFAGDVAEGIFRTMAGDDFPAGEIFNIGSGAAVTIRELGEAVQAAAGGGGELAWGALAYRDGEIMHLTVDTGKASAVLGWRAKTALRDGLGLTVDAIRNEA